MDVTDRHHGDSGHGDDEFAVLLDALDVPFRPFVDPVDHPHAVAGVVFGCIRPEIPDIASGIGRGHQDERAHLFVPDGPRLAGLRLHIVHKDLIVNPFEIHKPLLGATHEQLRGDELLFDIDQASAVELLDGVQGDIRLHARRFQQGLQIDHPVVEHLEGVPMEAFGRGFDEFW